MNTEIRRILRAYGLIVTLVFSATAVSFAAAIITEQQRRTPPISIEELIGDVEEWLAEKVKY